MRVFWDQPYRRLLLAGTLGASLITGSGAIVFLDSEADTTLIESAADNNLGHQRFFNSGTTQVFTRNRGLIRFDLSSIPSGARITDAALTLEVTGAPDETPVPSSVFDLHRVLLPWGEGTKTNAPSGSPGQGEQATLNEATWNHRLALTTNEWTGPGAQAGSDYLTNVSAARSVFGVAESPYVFNALPQMISDLQLWLNAPSNNFGWILITESEERNFTARRFGSREDPLNAPYLMVNYVAPPMLTNIVSTNGRLQFSFTAESGPSYVVESKTALGIAQAWTTLTNIAPLAEETLVTISDGLTNSARFYRVRVP